METTIEILSSDNLSDALKAYFEGQISRVFGADELKYEWAVPDWWMYIASGADPVAWLALTDRRITAGDAAIRVAGIGSVVTLPDFRGKGYSTQLMKKAEDFLMEDLSMDAGLLLCGRDMLHFYKRLGWEEVRADLFFDQPAGRCRWEDHAMVLHGLRTEWPEGDIDLNGLPW